jgi:hypothetical protein
MARIVVTAFGSTGDINPFILSDQHRKYACLLIGVNPKVLRLWHKRMLLPDEHSSAVHPKPGVSSF